MTRRAWMVLLALLVGTGASAKGPEAQTAKKSGVSPGPGWQPRINSLDANAADIAAAERAKITARSDAIEAEFRKIPVLAEPDGFEVGGRMVMMGLGDKRQAELISYAYNLLFWSPTRAINGEVLSVIRVTVNPYPGVLMDGFRPVVSENEGEAGQIYVEPSKREPAPGTVVYDSLQYGYPSSTQVLLTAPGASPWVGVSRERYLKAQIAVYKKEDAAFKDANSQTAYQRWMSEAPKRKKDREAVAAEIAASDKQKGAAYLKTMEQTEKDVGEGLKAQEASQREQADQVASTPSIYTKLSAQLAAMSPSERAAPAWVKSAGETFDLVSPETQGAVRLVALNPDFFRAKGSRVAVRGIVVRFDWVGDPYRDPSDMDQAIYKAHKKLDYAALRR
ncbi:MAG: hypothetical protein ACRENN_11355, partial [Candidatus Eiseniibacteriota bacterium]